MKFGFQMDYDEEVRRRKEYADRKVRERHEKMKKEMDEKRKNIKEHRERVQSQLRREQELIQKRMQQLNEDEDRKKATLAKQHTETSRIANLSKSPKQAGFGFGSGTPRTLAYLDNLPKSEQLYDKRLKPTIGTVLESGLTTPQSRSGRNSGTGMGLPSRPPPAARRPPPAMNAMTSSMYVAPNPRHSLRQPPPPPKPATIRTTPPRQSPSMTQSVYTPSRTTTTVRSTVVLAAPRAARRTPTKPPIQQKIDVAQPARVKKTVKAQIPDEKSSEEPQVVPEVTKVELALEVEQNSESLLEEPEIAQESVEEIHNIPLKIEESSPEVTQEASEVENHSGTPEVSEVVIAPNDLESASEVHAKEESDVEHKLEEGSEAVVEQDSEVEQITVIENLKSEIEAPEALNEVSEEVEAVEFHEETPEYVEQDSEVKQVTVIEKLDNAPAPEALNEVTEESAEFKEGASEVVSPHPEDPESYELKYEEQPISAKSELVDVFGNDFIGEKVEDEVRRRPAFDLEDDEEADSGKASPSEDDSGAESSPEEEQKTPRQSPEQAPIVPLVKKLPTKSIEDLEKEQKEAEDRKRRLEAILAKSRGMSMPTATILPGAIQDPSPVPPSPPAIATVSPTPTTVAQNEEQNRIVQQTSTGSSSSDLLSRLASNSNLPHLQKLLQRKAANNSNPSLETQETPSGGEIQYH